MALELSFVNSNLQLLKEQLAELNSSVEVKEEQICLSCPNELPNCRCTRQSRQSR